MSEKVLGFKAENKSRIKFSDSKKVYIRVPEKDLVPVRLASESVDLKALKKKLIGIIGAIKSKEFEEHRKYAKHKHEINCMGIAIVNQFNDLLSWAEKQAGEKK